MILRCQEQWEYACKDASSKYNQTYDDHDDKQNVIVKKMEKIIPVLAVAFC